jgi:hypothetical protein
VQSEKIRDSDNKQGWEIKRLVEVCVGLTLQEMDVKQEVIELE